MNECRNIWHMATLKTTLPEHEIQSIAYNLKLQYQHGVWCCLIIFRGPDEWRHNLKRVCKRASHQFASSLSPLVRINNDWLTILIFLSALGNRFLYFPTGSMKVRQIYLYHFSEAVEKYTQSCSRTTEVLGKLLHWLLCTYQSAFHLLWTFYCLCTS